MSIQLLRVLPEGFMIPKDAFIRFKGTGATDKYYFTEKS